MVVELANVSIYPREGTVGLEFTEPVQILNTPAVFYTGEPDSITHASGLIAPTVQRVLSRLIADHHVMWVGYPIDDTEACRSTVIIGVTGGHEREIIGMIRRLTPIINAMNEITGNSEIGTVDALIETHQKVVATHTWRQANEELVVFLGTHFVMAFNAMLAWELR